MLLSTIGMPGWPASATAQSTTADATAQSTTANVSVVLVLDNSGSMGAPGVANPSDPERLRFSAAKMFVKLLDVGDRVGLVLFADGVVDSSDLITVGGEADKEGFLPKLNEREAGGFTNMKSALERAGEILRSDSSGNEQFVVFLTDGRPEIDGTNPETPEAFVPWWDETLEVARGMRAPILTIGLTSEGDTQYLRQLAALTGGRSFPAERSDQLAAAYLQVFGHLKDRLVAEPAEGSTAQAARFRVGGGIRRAYFVVVSRQPPQASLTVSGAQAPVASWTEKRFSVFTYAPQSGAQVPPGDWAVQLSAPADSVRAILISRFRLRVTSPGAGIGPLGRPLHLSAYLSELRDDGASVRLPSDRIEVQVEAPGGASARPALTDDGTSGDARAGDLLYSFAYGATDAPGLYRLRFTAYSGGQAIQNDAPIELQLEPFPSLTLDAPESREHRLTGDPLPVRARVLLGQQAQPLASGRLVADLQRDGRSVGRVPLTADGDAFVASLRPDESGRYVVRVQTEDAVHKGLPLDLTAEVPFQVNVVPRVSLDGGPVQFVAYAGGPLRDVLGTARVRIDAASPLALQVVAEGTPPLRLRLDPEAPRPGQQADVRVLLNSDTALEPGVFDGRLVWSAAREAEFVPTTSVPFRLEVKKPVVVLDAPTLVLALEDGCVGTEAGGAVSATARASGPITLSGGAEFGPGGAVQGRLAGSPLQPDAPTRVGLTFALAQQLPPGRHEGAVRLRAAPDAVFEPGDTVRVALEVPSWVERNLWWIRLALGALAFLPILLFAIRRPAPWGRFVVTSAPAGGRVRSGQRLRPNSWPLGWLTASGSLNVPGAGTASLRTVSHQRNRLRVRFSQRGGLPVTLDNGTVVTVGNVSLRYEGRTKSQWSPAATAAFVILGTLALGAALAFVLPLLLGAQIAQIAGGC